MKQRLRTQVKYDHLKYALCNEKYRNKKWIVTNKQNKKKK